MLVKDSRDEIVVAGWSCRLPGADSIADLWSLLRDGRCAVTQVPGDRFSQERYYHPRRQVRGKSYTFRAGVLGDVWGFDPAVFGISPREAEQMDPQQRLLLQLTWEALEDGGIRPSSIAGEEVGVFVGGSLTDYSHPFIIDQAIGDAYFATGNALASLSNRISYCFNLKGPSMTVDTACSSSLVALHQAMNEMRAGRIDTAIVAGVNIIGSPMSFITFSQASMLSPTGLCHAFDAGADGFVRAEGGAVVILRKASLAKKERNPVHGVIVATDVNSDGRTSGMALPSWEAQQALLGRIYSRAGVDPATLAFVEAHGTGTAVGDPAEARALGQGLGQKRKAPLPIGSIKTNIGHLEPAAGITGLLKALLALKHRALPSSLHFNKPNPHIDFDRLNLRVCDQPLPLPDAQRQFAGVNSFGFGGTNAHVIVAAAQTAGLHLLTDEQSAARIFSISAETKPALAALAEKYISHLEPLSDQEAAQVSSTAGWRRDRLRHQLVVSSTGRGDIISALKACRAGEEHPLLSAGQSCGAGLPTAFVFSGNGGQRVGMGIAAYKGSAEFRTRFDHIDQYFQPLAGWSLKHAIFDPNLGERLDLTSVAQPLIFAIQSAMAGALRELGIVPTAVLGHSVGEVAAAEAAGIVDTETAVRIIYYRSTYQELTHHAGAMGVLGASADVARELFAAIPGVELAAINSPRAVTAAGTKEALAALRLAALSRGIAYIDLNLNYPFHTSLMAPIEKPLLRDLAGITPVQGAVRFISTVTGNEPPLSRLGAEYWWHNVRDPVRYSDAIAAAAKLGIRCFIEIGPNPVLTKHTTDCLIGEAQEHIVLSCPDPRDEGAAPFDRVVARALIAGADVSPAALFGADPGGTLPLPSYSWQKTQFRYVPTVEAVDVVEQDRHRLSGVRDGIDALQWHAHIDTDLIPDFGDHQVGARVLFPATGFLEIALSVARQALGCAQLSLRNLEILRPLDLSNCKTYEIMTRLSPASNVIEILSRARLSKSDWALNARGKIFRAELPESSEIPAPGNLRRIIDADALYRIGRDSGLNYGPAFQQAARVSIHDNDLIVVDLKPIAAAGEFLLDPVRTDACVQGFIAILPELRAAERGVAYVPVRVDDVLLLQSNMMPQRAVIEIKRKSDRSIHADAHILAGDGSLIVSLRGVRFQTFPIRRLETLEAIGLQAALVPGDGALLGESGMDAGVDAIVAAAKRLELTAEKPQSESDRLIEIWALAAMREIAGGLATESLLAPALLIADGRLPAALEPWLTQLLRVLQRAGMASHRDGIWTLRRAKTVFSSAAMIGPLAGNFPERAAEILVMSEMSGFAARVAAERKITQSPDDILSASALEFLGLGMANRTRAGDALWPLLQQDIFPARRLARVLQIGAGSITEKILGAGADVTVLEPDQARLSRAQIAFPRRGDVSFTASLPPAPETFDLVLAPEGLGRFGAPPDMLHAAMAPGGLLVGITPLATPFHDLISGLCAGADALPPDQAGLEAELEAMGFAGAKTAILHSGGRKVLLFAASKPGAAAPIAAPVPFRSQAANNDWAFHLHAQLAHGSEEDGRDINVRVMASHDHAGSDPVTALSQECLALKALAEQAAARSTLVLVFSDALGADPVSAGAWAFARTLANEFSNLDFKRIDVAPDVTPARAAKEIVRILNMRSIETELRIERDTVRVVRVDTIRRRSPQKRDYNWRAARLELSQSSPGRVKWQPFKRGSLKPDDVEIAVEAAGLNFRDLMWALRLLPDDMLENGFTGPTLGLECAGRVARIGSAVKAFAPGDRVLAMAGGAFSTHVTVCEKAVAALPDSFSFEAAATVPVAFLTAWYSLVTQARLKRGEWVLIHGGAGGVGLAAIQIAQSLGAKIIATAGSNAKRELLKSLGVQHVLNSRSTAFVEEVRRITKNGVQVVLNSLAQEAMEQSLSCLAPFGRFVELGKRDYISDTQIGLRVFRMNASYFGVDVDQLMARGDAAPKLLKRILKGLGTGGLKPLLYTAFEASDVSGAFGAMQQSTHVGKIVVRPPRGGALPVENMNFAIDRSGTHLVTGAFGGFGLETAKWLVERGARNLVLLSRNGPASDEAMAALAEFSTCGVKFLCEKCDVSDREALARVFAKAKRELPPITGIIHSAMVLDDSIIANLDETRLRAVLSPKVAGAVHLDALSRDLPLEYFLLYSSVTTLIGNPGQGNYVAANAFMEGLARRRRRDGLPALAIGWGPILDAGVVARSEKLKVDLQRLSGARGMTSREALALMSQALELSGSDANLAVITIAPNDGKFGEDHLKVLRSPTYAALLKAGSAREASTELFDIVALAKTMEIGVVTRKVGDLIVEHLSRVLHAPAEDINRTRRLGEIGLDSLMAIELAMNLEELFGVTVSLTGSSSNLTVVGLAENIVAQVVGSAGMDADPEPAFSPMPETMQSSVLPPEAKIAAADAPANDADTAASPAPDFLKVLK